MEISYNFDSVAMKPNKNVCSSRLEANITSEIIKGVTRPVPVIGSNMSSVMNAEFAIILYNLGALGIMHRAWPNEEDYLQEVKKVAFHCEWVAASIGIDENAFSLATKLVGNGVNILCIDVANGYCDAAITLGKRIKDRYKENVKLIIGNTTNINMMSEVKDFADALKIGVGSNNCFVGDTRVLMADGSYKNIKDINIHDKVINMYGNPVEVVSVKFTGFKNVVSYKNNYFYKNTLVTGDHKHFVGDFSNIKNIDKCVLRKVLDKETKESLSKYKWVEIKDFNKHVLLIPKNINFELKNSFEIHLDDYYHQRSSYFNKYDKIIKPSYDLGYIFGMFLGDGCSSLYRDRKSSRLRGSVVWSFGLHETEKALKLKEALLKEFDANVNIKIKKNVLQVISGKTTLARFFKQFGKKTSKKLPEAYVVDNLQYLEGVHDGLVDSDGCISDDGRYSFTNTSIHLIELYMFIFYKLNNYYPSMQEQEATPDNFLSLGKIVKQENIHKPYTARSVKNPKFNQTKNYQISKIYSGINYKHLYLPTYDIEVNCPSHSFIANNAIVHNSVCHTYDVTGFTEGQFSAVLKFKDLKKEDKIPIISDGGIRKPNAFCKAIAAGASSVMLGTVLARCPESAAEFVETPDGLKKFYYGMASRTAQVIWKGGVKQGTCTEGTVKYLDIGESVSNLMERYAGALRSSITYSGGTDIETFQKLVEFVELR